MNLPWFDTLKSALAAKLTAFINASQNVNEERVSFCVHCGNAPSREVMLSLLHAQTMTPKLFWQHRDTDDTHDAAFCAAIGAAQTFASVAEASHAVKSDTITTIFATNDDSVKKKTIDTSVKLWGVNAFPMPDAASPKNAPLSKDSKDFWFLPRFEWRVIGRSVFLYAHLYSQTNVIADARDALAALVRMAKPLPLPVFDHHGELLQVTPDRQAWEVIITRATAMIASGAMKKVVPARRVTYSFDKPVSPEAFLAESLKKNRHCYHFMMVFPDGRAFLGATPERLFRREGNTLFTEALAGTTLNATRREEATKLADALSHDPKNVHEHRLVIDDITERLSDIADALEIKPMEVVRLRKIQHLRSAITARLRVADDALCVARLQPTAAVAGLPRKEAMKFLADFEPFPREWYAGSIGYCAGSHAEFAVTLRCALVDHTRVRFYAGCGIVAGSRPEEEWQELNNKTAALGSLFPRLKEHE